MTVLPAYTLPPAIYFKQSDQLTTISPFEKYVKQSLRNRFYINTGQGPMLITIPVKKPWKNKYVFEIEIYREEKWIKDLWKTITSAYGKSPFFDHYSPYFESVFKDMPSLLYDLNKALLNLSIKFLNLTSHFQFAPINFDRLEHKIDWTLSERYDKVYSSKHDQLSYPQHFGNEFASNLSVIDLLFNIGPESRLYLNKL